MTITKLKKLELRGAVESYPKLPEAQTRSFIRENLRKAIFSVCMEIYCKQMFLKDDSQEGCSH